MLRTEEGSMPSRVVHGKGAGASGYFETTHSCLAGVCRTAALSEVGRRTPVAARFSTVGGAEDTARDLRGFAVRFYTDQGIWDLVGNNFPVFFIGDPAMFPSFVHSQRRSSAQQLGEPNMLWDFLTLCPETMHQVTLLFSDRGIPDGYRHMNGYGSHTFKLVNHSGQHVWAKLHFKTDQGIRNLSVERAKMLAQIDPDYAMHDLHAAIASGLHPSWTVCVQLMSPGQAEQCPFDPFDLTRVWPHAQYPLHQVGRLVLNKNPSDYTKEVEQLAFSPANMPPGIEASPDKMLQSRLSAYEDSHRYRLGPHYQNLPVNCRNHGRLPASSQEPAEQDNPASNNNNVSRDVRVPHQFSQSPPLLTPKDGWSEGSKAERFDNGAAQIRAFWERVLNEEQRQRLVENMAEHAKDAHVFIQARIVRNWSGVSEDFGSRLRQALVRRNPELKAQKLARLLLLRVGVA